MLFIVWSLISIFFTILIAGLIVYFMTRYRRRHPEEVGRRTSARPCGWRSAGRSCRWPSCSSMFVWGTGSSSSSTGRRPTPSSTPSSASSGCGSSSIRTGQREINELHVPVGQPVRLTLTSEDVIHSFYVPAFRVKQDAVPGRYTSIWFDATKPGVYHLFCAEYCGTEHSRMIGSIIVMEPRDYEAWLAGGAAGKSLAASRRRPLPVAGLRDLPPGGASGRIARGPALEGLYGSQSKLADGRTVIADDTYIRESILTPTAKVVAGYEPVMPTFQGQVSEEQLTQLIAYIKSLGPAGSAPAGGRRSDAGTDAAGGRCTTRRPQARRSSRIETAMDTTVAARPSRPLRRPPSSGRTTSTPPTA